jgi:hypothetical protein
MHGRMATALHSIGSELCDDLERLAPLTRAPRPSALDLTAATLAVRAERLRAQLSLAFGTHALAVDDDRRDARRDDAERARARVSEDVAEISELVRSWRATHTQSDAARNEAALLAAGVALERGALLSRLMRQ